MIKRVRAGNSWIAWYARQREAEVLHAELVPSCPNCGWQPEPTGDRSPVAERCPECWARLQAVSQ